VSQIYQVSSRSSKKCKRSLLHKLERIYADRSTEYRQRSKACDWHSDCYIPHCNTFYNVYHVLSRYLIWHLSENCKQYNLSTWKNTCFCKTFIFNCIASSINASELTKWLKVI